MTEELSESEKGFWNWLITTAEELSKCPFDSLGPNQKLEIAQRAETVLSQYGKGDILLGCITSMAALHLSRFHGLGSESWKQVNAYAENNSFPNLACVSKRLSSI